MKQCVKACPEITGARILKKNELTVPDSLAEATTEMSETTEMPEMDERVVEVESKECQENEEFVECSRRCELHCHIPIWDGCEFSGPCVPRCECKQGYARNAENECVLEEECLSVPCDDPNEVRKRQGLKDSCRPTCEYRNFTVCSANNYDQRICDRKK
ncbi:hypothetical protein ANCCAN_03878 [Ancylostoma caninum]|uniref:TIL domain-containing protein n=1 Tax=Ancylostoma caninum TaxID=29170 RepID=A0A368H2R2_ANCCA|nr:hypothetical protein ANCCAN_03878 [Ancylostoma caninum]